MQDLTVHAFIAYIICPGIVYYAVRTMNRHADIRSPKIWWAVAAGVYGMLAVILGLVQSAWAAADLGNLADWQDPWWATLLAMALSLLLCFWMLLVAENRFFAKHSEFLE